MNEVAGKNVEKEILEMFRIDKKVEDSSKPRPLLIKLENLMIQSLMLDNSKLRESEIKESNPSQDLSKEDRDEGKKLFLNKHC